MNSLRKIWIMLAGILIILAMAETAPAGSFPWVEHSVSLIDTLESIADHYGIESSSLRWANELPDDEIPFTLEIILVPLDENLLVETRAEVRARKNGSTTEGLYSQDDEEDYSAFTTREAEAGQSWTPPPPVISFKWPTEGKLFSKFGPRRGRFHAGIDISAPRGTPIKAAAAGTVVRAAWRGGYGRSILIDHGNGSMTRYAHCDKMLCRAGDSVAAGQKIGTVGRSGRSTGYHLHFEIIINGRHQNPEKHLPPKTE